MLYDNIIDQEESCNHLQHAVQSNRLASSYLFTGPEGVGKRKTAEAFAASLLCEASAPQNCGICHSCQLFISGHHPDFVTISLDQKRKMIPVESVRNEVNRFNIKPYTAPYRILMIDDAHTLSTEAMNTLLKTMEEPPSYGIVLLLSHLKSSILPTILSRCQILHFHPLSRSSVKKIIATLYPEIPPHLIQHASDLSCGSTATALRYLGDEEGSDLARLQEITKGIATSDIAHITDTYLKKQTGQEQRRRARVLFDYLILAIRSVMMYKDHPTRSEGQSFDQLFMERFHSVARVDVMNVLDQLIETSLLLDKNTNVQTVLMEGMLILTADQQTRDVY